MNIKELIGKISQYSQSVLVGKAKSWMSKFAIGAGTEAMLARVEPLIRTTGTVSENGIVDLDRLHAIVMKGFNAAGHLDLFGGMIGFDAQDVEDMFAWIRR